MPGRLRAAGPGWALSRRRDRELEHRQLGREHRQQAARGVTDALRRRIVRIAEDERFAGVRLLAKRHRQRDLADERHVELVGELLAAALAEDREALARGGDEAGHVLDHARDLEVDLLRHLGRAARDLLRRRLRRRDDQELRLRQQLGERHRDVAGARREVDEQEVQLAPFDVLEELRQRLVQHRAAPDDRRVLLDEEADRHDLHAARLERQDLARPRRPRGARRRRTCAGSSSPRRRRRARRRACRRRRAPRRGWP